MTCINQMIKERIKLIKMRNSLIIVLFLLAPIYPVLGSDVSRNEIQQFAQVNNNYTIEYDLTLNPLPSESIFLSELDSDNPRINNYYQENIINDTTLFEYLGIKRIHGTNFNGTTGEITNVVGGIKIAVFDHLIDFRHPNLKRIEIVGSNFNWENRAVKKVILVNHESEGNVNDIGYKSISGYTLDSIYPNSTQTIYKNMALSDYIAHGNQFGHGTSVAGIINQIAPGSEIISIAYPTDLTEQGFYYCVYNFLKWLKDEGIGLGIKIVNISQHWDTFSDDQKNTIREKILDLLQNDITFIVSAGNKIEGDLADIKFPGRLANNWESDFYTNYGNKTVIINKNEYGEIAIANGFISVGGIYDNGSQAGVRVENWRYDVDKNSDLKIMAPGYDIRTTYPTWQNEETIHQANFTGTSAAAPVITGIAALLASRNQSLANYEIEKILSQYAIKDSNVLIEGDEYQQKYGHGMVNPIETLADYDSTLYNLDYDNDDLLDVEELYIHHTNPNNNDTDQDGLLDGAEVNIYGTMPNNSDSDSDGIDDLEEVTEGIDGYITDPTNNDTDGDYIDDYEEVNLGIDGFITNPTSNDSDSDGIQDYFEIHLYNTDPNDSDTDNDGLVDVDEIHTYFTDPNNLDTDEDGLTDFEEIFQYNTDPNDADSDNDLLNDGAEVNIYDTDPNDPDSDSDGLWDGYEILTHLTDPNDSDSDNDLMNDGWEVNNGLNPNFNDANNDEDVDGLTNYEEYILGTNPNNVDTDYDGMPDKWEVDNNLQPLIDDSEDDNDDDELTNIDEYLNGTNPRDWDSDNDLISDAWEVQYGLNPLSASDSDDDNDNDGLTNLEEYQWNTNPQNEDTDGDLMPDGWEVENDLSPTSQYGDDGSAGDIDGDYLLNLEEYYFGTYANDPDCDDDGITDFQEVFEGYDTVITDPFNPDTDGDGLDDWEETHYGIDGVRSNPTLIDTDGDLLDDLEESTLGNDGFITDPENIDTDGDLLTDFQETMTYFTNPLDPDHDNDLLTDYQEVITLGTNPFVNDTDLDGYTDYEEYIMGSDGDPLNPFYPNISPDNLLIVQLANSYDLFIEWDEMGGVFNYCIKYKPDWAYSWTVLYTNLSFIQLSDLIVGTYYIFEVSAQSAYNNEWSSANTVYCWTRQPQPVAVILTVSNYIDITVEYFLSPNASKLELTYKKEGCEWEFIANFTSNGSITLENKEINTYYYFRTRQMYIGMFYEDQYWSVYSNISSIQTTQEPIPNSVRYFNGSPGGTKVTFTWSHPTNYISGWKYLIWRKLGSGSYSLIKQTYSTSFIHYPPDPYAVYTYKIVCYNNQDLAGSPSYWTGKAKTTGGGGPL